MATMAALRSGWSGTGAAGNPYRPAVVAKYSLTDWTDVGGMNIENEGTSVNLTAAQAVVDAIAADADYGAAVTRTFFASPNGSASGNGSFDYPWDLATALGKATTILGGDRLCLRGGTYHGVYFNIDLKGVEGSEVTIEPYLAEKPIVDGALIFRGQYVVAKYLEIYDADFLNRTTSIWGTEPPDIPLYAGAIANVANVRLLNSVIHDCRQGPLGGFKEIYGCLVYHCGWNYALGTGTLGHGIYSGNGTSGAVRDNILFGGFGYGIHIYGSSSPLTDYLVEGNTAFESGMLRNIPQSNILVGGDGSAVATTPTLRANMTYFVAGTPPNKLGLSAGATDATIENNYMPEGLTKTNVTVLSESGNYYGPDVGDQVFVRPNEYQTDRANVTIYNEARADSISVDLTSVIGLNAGDSVTVANVQDYFVDIQTLTLDADKKITVDMQAANRTVAAPQGWAAEPTTFPTFGCMVVEKA